MPLHAAHENFRNARYAGEQYAPDPLLGHPLNAAERALLMSEIPAGQRIEYNPDPGTVTAELTAFAATPGGAKRLTFKDPVINAYATVAYARANADLVSWRDGPVYPDDPQSNLRFPGVDPLGKFCSRDMSLAFRMNRIKAAVLTVDPAHHAALVTAIHQLSDSDGPLGQELSAAKDLFNAAREAERAAKLCPDPVTAELLETSMNKEFANSPAMQKLESRYSALETLLGIRQEPLTQEMTQALEQMNLPAALGHDPTALTKLPQLPVKFEDFDHVVQQAYFANPANWGIRPRDIPAEPRDEAALSTLAGRFAAATVEPMLDSLYRQTETKFGMANSRGNMVVIDGLTVEERMQMEYQQMEKTTPATFDEWYKANLKQKTNAYVSAALMTGKRVEAYVADADGKLAPEPVRLTAQGYAPTPQKPVTMNAWQKFWNRFGFYKEKAVQAQQDQRSAEAKAWVETRYLSGTMNTVALSSERMKDMMLGDYFRNGPIRNLDDFCEVVKQGGEPVTTINTTQRINGREVQIQVKQHHGELSKVPLGRSSVVSAVVMKMMADGHDIRKILDPNALTRERNEAARSVMDDFITASKPEKESRTPAENQEIRDATTRLARLYKDGQAAMIQQIDTVMKGVDTKDRAQMLRAMPVLSLCTEALFDSTQDTRVPKITKAMAQLMPNGTVAEANAWIERMTQVAEPCQKLVSHVGGLSKLANADYGHIQQSFTDAVMGEMVLAQVNASRAEKFTSRLPNNRWYASTLSAMGMSPDVDSIQKKVVRSVEGKMAVSRLSAKGELTKEINFQMKEDFNMNAQCSSKLTKVLNQPKPAPQRASQMGPK